MRLTGTRPLLRATLTLGLLAFGATVARATVIVSADLQVLAAEATVIVRGVVVDVRAQRAFDGGRIDSVVTIEASTYWKGDLGDTVTLRVPGGRLGRYRSVVVGAPVFAPGDEVVLFLGGGAPALPYVIGLSQGLYRIVGDPASDRLVVAPSPHLSQTEPVRIARGDPARRLATVDEFGALLADVLAGQSGGRR